MKETLLDQYEEWKKRRRPNPDIYIKNYYSEGISIAGKLLQLGCHKDRDGMDIHLQIHDMEELLRNIEKMEPRQ
jgi:hypothetical protein